MTFTKIRFITLLVLLSLAGRAAARECVDTIAVLRGVSSVLLTSEGGEASEITVEVEASGDTPAYTYKYSSRVSESERPLISGDSLTLDLPFMQAARRSGLRLFYAVWGKDVHAGAVVPLANAPGIRTGWELGISKIAGVGFRPWRGGPTLELCLGLVYRNLRLDHGHIFGSDNRGTLFIEPVPEGFTEASSRLDLWSVTVPLTLRQGFGRNFYVDLGIEMSLNFSAKATRNYRSADGSARYSQTLKHLHQRPVGMNLKFAIGCSDIIGAYVRYSPVSLFASGLGPQTDFLSAGATLVF